MTQPNMIHQPPVDKHVNRVLPPLEEKLFSWEQLSTSSSVEELATCIAHDLIQPLSDIVNNVWLCRELIERSSAAHEPLMNIEDQAMRVAEMIRQVRRLVGTLSFRLPSDDQSGQCDTAF